MNSKSTIFLLLGLLLIACSDVKDPRYKDTTELEVPPEMEVAKKPQQPVKNNVENAEDKGLGDVVRLAGTEAIPVIKIKKLFSRSWELIEQALKLNGIEITDKNREQGVFYVVYAADGGNTGETKSFGNITSFFFNDASTEARYKLSVAWRESNTEVSAGLVMQTDEGLLDDDEDIEDFEGAVDNGAALLNALYKTMKDDLPIS